MTSKCVTTPDDQWVAERFEGRCYFYPARDCPGWQHGSECGRIGHPIPWRTLEECAEFVAWGPDE